VPAFQYSLTLGARCAGASFKVVNGTLLQLPQRSQASHIASSSRHDLELLYAHPHILYIGWHSTIYCDDRTIEIDKSAAERALRGVAIGRRNYLFAGADSDGERAAAIYTLIGTAKLKGVDPEAWLRHVLARIADHPVNQVADLLPWNVALN
jgi:hypothetical protein